MNHLLPLVKVKLVSLMDSIILELLLKQIRLQDDLIPWNLNDSELFKFLSHAQVQKFK